MNKKKIYTYVGVAAVGLMMAAPTHAVGGQGIGSGSGNGNGQRGGQGMIDKNDNGIPDGMEDFDGDGVINRDDDDFDKEYINMKDTDEDGIANSVDEDYEPAEYGTNRPETAGQKQMTQNRAQAQQQDADGAQVRATNRNQNRVMNQNNNPEIGEQIRTMIQAREQLQQEVADDVVQLQKQDGLGRFVVGVDQGVVEHAKWRINQYEEKIEQLKELSENTTNIEDKNLIDEQITQMESKNIQMQRLVEKNSEGFSLFGWVANIFN